MIAHAHTPGIVEGCYQTGTSTYVEALEKIVCVYANPTGAQDDEHDLIMSCRGWWLEQQAATEQGESE